MMFEAYMKERQNADCLKYDKGFVFYRIVDSECFIVEMFIEKEARGSGLFKDMILDLSLKAKVLTANIHLNAEGSNHALKSALRVGFKVVQANNNILLIVKES